jgi:hypothetical protein
VRPSEIPDELVGCPFTLAEARAAGVSRKVLRGQRFASTGRGTYVRVRSALDEATLIHSALLTLPPQTLVTGVSGLRLLGVMVGSPDPLHFVTTHPRQVRRRGVRVTRVINLPPHRESVAVVEHCWMVAALDLNLLDLITAGDWLLRAELTTLPQLRAFVEGRSSRGAGVARKAVGLVRERVDSPRETWLRLCLVFAGLPTPQCNPVVDGDRRSARVDLVYLEFGVLIEYEGDQHRGDKRQWNRDIDRYDDFMNARFVVIRITAERARYPRLVVRRVYEAIRNGGYRGPEPVFDQRWMGLFEK